MIAPIVIEVVGDPQPHPRSRARMVQTKDGRRFTQFYAPTGAHEQWRAAVERAVLEHRPAEPMSGPIGVSIEFRARRPSSHYGTGRNRGVLKREHAGDWWAIACDRDNLDKLILDVLAGEWVDGSRTYNKFFDDRQVCDGRLVKRYAGPGERPGATIIIQRLTEEHANGSDEDSLFDEGKEGADGRAEAVQLAGARQGHRQAHEEAVVRRKRRRSNGQEEGPAARAEAAVHQPGAGPGAARGPGPGVEGVASVEF